MENTGKTPGGNAWIVVVFVSEDLAAHAGFHGLDVVYNTPCLRLEVHKSRSPAADLQQVCAHINIARKQERTTSGFVAAIVNHVPLVDWSIGRPVMVLSSLLLQR